MITYRVLEQSEHHLASAPDGVEFPPVAIVIGGFNEEGELVARTSLIPVPHIEGTWVKEGERKGFVGFQLLQRIERVAQNALGAQTVFAFLPDAQPELQDYLSRLGYEKQPLTVWIKFLDLPEGESPCQ